MSSALKFYRLAMLARRFAVLFDAPSVQRRFDLVSGSILLAIAAVLAAGSIAGN